jgi:hypothetical protein
MRRFLRSIICRAVGHRRSRRRAYVDPVEKRWRSYCRRCGAAMRKDGLLGWRESRDS